MKPFEFIYESILNERGRGFLGDKQFNDDGTFNVTFPDGKTETFRTPQQLYHYRVRNGWLDHDATTTAVTKSSAQKQQTQQNKTVSKKSTASAELPVVKKTGAADKKASTPTSNEPVVKKQVSNISKGVSKVDDPEHNYDLYTGYAKNNPVYKS